MKYKNNKLDIESVVLSISLVFIYLANILIIFRPSLNIRFLDFVISNEFFIVLITISYPLYILIFYWLVTKYLNFNRNGTFIVMFTILNIISFTVAQLAKIIEYRNYPNYLYSTYHVFMPLLIRFSYYEVGIILLGLYAFFLKKKNLKLNLLASASRFTVRPEMFVALFLLLLVYKVMVIDFVPAVIDEVKQQINANGMKVDFKYRATDMPQLSIKTQFLRKYSDPNSVFVNPSQSWDYSDIGNQVLIRYFLYPRTLVSYSKLDEFMSDLKTSKYSDNCKMYIIASKSYVDKNKFFPDYKDLVVKKVTALYVSGSVNEFHNVNNTTLRQIVLDDNFFIGLLETEKCILF